MATKSIDGLNNLNKRKNTGSSTTKKRKKPLPHKKGKKIPVKSGKKIKDASKKIKTTVGITDSKSDLVRAIKENEELERKSKNKIREASARMFFNNIKDSDPTDLVEENKLEIGRDFHKKVKRRRVIKRIIIAILILLLIGGVVIFFYLNDFVSTITDNGNIFNVLFSDPDTPLEKDEYGRTNIVLFGTEGYIMDDPQYDGGFLTDAMMLISIDQESGNVKAVSMPRDLLMNQTCTATSKMNEIYWCEYLNYLNSDKKTNELKKKYEKSAANKLAEKIEEITGLKVQYKAHVNWAALIDVINALDGIDVCFYHGKNNCDSDTTAIEVSDERGLSEQNMETGKVYFKYKTGKKYHLVGHKALQVARARNAHGGYGASGGNFSREYFQQRIIEATAQKAKVKNLDLDTVLKLKKTLGDNVRTTFKDSEIKTLIKLISNTGFEKIETLSLEKEGLLTDGYVNGISYILPSAGRFDYSAIKAYMKRKMTNSSDFTTEDAKIIVMNGSNTDGLAGSEKTTLIDKGFNVIDTTNAPKKISGDKGVKIYQLNNEKTKTAKALKKHYGVDIKKEIPDSLKKYQCDFIIIIGNKKK